MNDVLLNEEQTNKKIITLLNRKNRELGLDEEFGQVTMDTFKDIATIRL